MNAALGLLATLGMFLLPLCVQAQTSLTKADSLFEALTVANSDTSKHTRLNELIWLYLDLPITEGRSQAMKCLEYAEESQSKLLQVAAWEGLRNFYWTHALLDSALYATNKTLDLIEECDAAYCFKLKPYLRIDILDLNNNLGQNQRILAIVDSLLSSGELSEEETFSVLGLKAHAYSELGAHHLALQLNLDLLRSPLAINDPKKELEIIQSLILTYNYLGDNDKAWYWSQKALAPSRVHLQNDQLVNILYMYSGFLTQQPDFGPSEFSQALEMGQEILDLADSLSEEKNYFHTAAIEIFINAYRRVDDLKDPALLDKLHILEQMAARPTAFPLVHTRRNAFAELARYNSEISQHEKAIDYAHKHLAHVVKSLKDTGELLQFAFEELHIIEAAAGNHEEAYKALESFHACTMTMLDRTEAEALAQASAAIDLDDAQLARQQAEQEIELERQASAARSRFFWLAFFAGSIVLAVVGWAYLRSRKDGRLIAQQNQVVNQSLSEKEVLLREIHHRVKNNLQIISSLLQKQAGQSESQELKNMIQDGQERIQSMALIHQNLYQSNQLGGVNINDYLLDLTKSVEKSHGSDPGNINIDLQVANEHIDIDTAIPLGLILNELITNAYKYAFPDGQVGKVIIKFYREADQFILRVSDDGVGLPSDVEVRKSHSLGLNLVKGLVRQLEGTIDWRQEAEGTAVSIRF
jgi:two-component sensor histidine kinase